MVEHMDKMRRSLVEMGGPPKRVKLLVNECEKNGNEVEEEEQEGKKDD